jgi:two-component system nitrogen regulation response regulator GlnG
LSGDQHDRKLEELVDQGAFREDLYYRLKVYAIHLPPLRDRRADLPLLVEHFRQRFNRELGKSIRSVPAEVLELLQAYPWPGNVRELQSAVKFAFVQATGDILAPHWLPENLQQPQIAARSASVRETRSATLDIAQLVRELIDANQSDIYRRVHAEVDQILLPEVLRHVQGNQVLASQRLGISRTTLRAKLGAFEPDAQAQTNAE